MITCLICAFDMAEKGIFFGGDSSFMLICSFGSGAEQKVSIDVLVFYSFDMASVADPTSCFPRLNMGTRALPLSVGAPDAYQCMVQMVLSSINCRKSSQWVLFVISIMIQYEFLAVCRLCGLAHLVCLSGHMNFFLIFVLPFVSGIVLLTTIAL